MDSVGRTTLLSIAILAFSLSLAIAAGWRTYGNARFGYSIDIPPGFSKVKESENSDGGVATSSNGNVELSVWGSYITEGDFTSEIGWRIDQDRSDGWNITYRKQQLKWAVWSGAKNNRVFYQRAIPVCGNAAAYFRIEYDREQVEAFAPTISRLGKSLRGGEC